MKKVYDGLLIAVEGIDGSGKTTQTKLLKKRLKKEGFETKIVKEPTDGEFGKKIKDILKEEIKVTQEKLLDLFVKDRKENVRKNIFPSLQEGKVVIADRYFISTLAYQKESNKSFKQLMKMHRFAPIPDLTVILDVKPKVAMKRLSGKSSVRDKFEKDMKLLKKARMNYRRIPEFLENKARVLIVDGERPPNEVNKEIWEEVKKLLK